jgi:hypothetical protein
VEEIFKKVDNWSELSMDEKKNICDFFIEKVWLTNERIDIDWKR